MRTTVEVDEDILAEAQRLTSSGDKEQTVATALRVLIEVMERPSLLLGEEKVEFWPDYDYKAMRENPHQDWDLTDDADEP